jgi:hypothetical protein
VPSTTTIVSSAESVWRGSRQAGATRMTELPDARAPADGPCPAADSQRALSSPSM